MRVMVIIHPTQNSEAGVMPEPQMFEEMGKFNEELVKAGIMLDGDGLKPSSHGKRVRFAGSERSVSDGPFDHTIAGFWIWKVSSMDEALAWVRRCPHPMPGEDAVIDIRPFYEAEDFGAEFTPEQRAQEERLRTELEARRQA